jgi:hypothetical protein
MVEKPKNTIVFNSTIIYTDGLSEFSEAMRLVDKGIIIGRIIDNEFVDCGFIPKNNIKEIKM